MSFKDSFGKLENEIRLQVLRMKNSVTVIEIIIVVVIIGIISSFAIPSYQNSIERSKAENAEFNLLAIYNAEKRYKLDQGSYYYCTADPCNLTNLKNNLGVDISEPYFDYRITKPAGINSFKAEAIRKPGNLCEGKKMTVTESGSTINKGCQIW